MDIRRRRIMAAIPAAVALATPSLAFAQLGGFMKHVGGGSGGGGGGADLGGQQEQLVRTYLAAGMDVNQANMHLAQALGVRTTQINMSATADSMSASDIEAQDKALSENAAMISEALKEDAKAMDEEAKRVYAQGLVMLASGIKRYMDMRSPAQGFASSLTSASPMMLPRLQTGAYIAKNLPGRITRLSEVLQAAIKFATANGIEVPKDATSVL